VKTIAGLSDPKIRRHAQNGVIDESELPLFTSKSTTGTSREMRVRIHPKSKPE
jgi:hypothetical protein